MPNGGVLRAHKIIVNLLNLNNLNLGKEFYYQHLPLCVIDSVFSIGIRYSTVQNVVKNFCTYFYWKEFRNPIPSGYPPILEQHSISDFINLYQKMGLNFTFFADKVYKNKNRTSSRNGILKAEAAYWFAKVLQQNGIEFFQDVQKILSNISLLQQVECQIKCIKGQGSGVSFDYFLMLAGDCNSVKPDRMVMRFLSSIYGVKIYKPKDAALYLGDLFAKLSSSVNNLTLRKLDYAIWSYQRSLIKIGKLGVGRNNGDLFVHIYTNSQKEFEESLKKLLEYIKNNKNDIKRVVFQTGGSLIIPDWFLKAIEELGIEVVFVDYFEYDENPDYLGDRYGKGE